MNAIFAHGTSVVTMKPHGLVLLVFHCIHLKFILDMFSHMTKHSFNSIMESHVDLVVFCRFPRNWKLGWANRIDVTPKVHSIINLNQTSTPEYICCQSIIFFVGILMKKNKDAHIIVH